MIKMIDTICRRPGMTHAESVAYVQHVHGAIAAEQPAGLNRYVQNHVFDAAFGAAGDRTHALVPARDSVTELYWPMRGAGAKVMHFLRAAEGLALPEFFDRWQRAHELALERAPAAAHAIRRCVHNRQLPEFNKMLAYFGGSDVFYEGVGSLWFDDVSSIGTFRAYERALLEINNASTLAFYRPSQSFFLYTTEVPIFQQRKQP